MSGSKNSSLKQARDLSSYRPSREVREWSEALDYNTLELSKKAG